METKCNTCTECESEVKDLAIHPTSSSCIWRTLKVYRCKANKYGDKPELPMKQKCDHYIKKVKK